MPNITLNIPYLINDLVYLKTDPDQQERLIIGITIRPNTSIMYLLALNDSSTWHYDIEISKTKDIFKVTTN